MAPAAAAGPGARPSDRIAILVIAHANPMTFGELAGALDDPRIAIFCHVDARADQAAFAEVGRHVHFLPDRRKNFWGDFTLVETSLALFKYAQNTERFQSYLLISGDSLPLVTNDLLLASARRRPTMLQYKEQHPGDHSYKRVTNVYAPMTRIGGFRIGTHLERYLEPVDMDMLLRALDTRALKDNIQFRVFKGSQWIALSDRHLSEMLEYIDRHPDFVELFRFSAIPDELFFHTLLKIITPDIVSGAGLVGVDWKRVPRPAVVRSTEELPTILAKPNSFFRKFSDQGLELVELVLANRRNHPKRRGEVLPPAEDEDAEEVVDEGDR